MTTHTLTPTHAPVTHSRKTHASTGSDVETAGLLGLFGVGSLSVRTPVVSSTVNVDLLSETVRPVVLAWNQLFDPSLGPEVHAEAAAEIAAAVPEPDVAAPMTAVEAVEFLADLLAVPEGRVLAAAGVRERTYYGWKKDPGSKPRRLSMGSLWPMTKTLSQLSRAHPDLRGWFQATPEAQDAFDAGDMGRIVQLEVEWIQQHAAALDLRNLTAAGLPAPCFGDRDDMDQLDEHDQHSDASNNSEGQVPRPAEVRLARSRSAQLSRHRSPAQLARKPSSIEQDPSEH